MGLLKCPLDIVTEWQCKSQRQRGHSAFYCLTLLAIHSHFPCILVFTCSISCSAYEGTTGCKAKKSGIIWGCVRGFLPHSVTEWLLNTEWNQVSLIREWVHFDVVSLWYCTAPCITRNLATHIFTVWDSHSRLIWYYHNFSLSSPEEDRPLFWCFSHSYVFPMNVQIQMILLQFHYSVDTLFKISHIHSYFHLAWASLTPKSKMSWVHGCGNQTQVAKLDGRCLYPLGILPTLISDFMTNNTQLVRSMEIFSNIPDQNRKNFLFYTLQMRVFFPQYPRNLDPGSPPSYPPRY